MRFRQKDGIFNKVKQVFDFMSCNFKNLELVGYVKEAKQLRSHVKAAAFILNRLIKCLQMLWFNLRLPWHTRQPAGKQHLTRGLECATYCCKELKVVAIIFNLLKEDWVFKFHFHSCSTKQT